MRDDERNPMPILVLPGASLMEVTPRPWGATVRCPGCGAVQHFMTGPAGSITSVAFVHEDGCEVLRQIEATKPRAQDAPGPEQVVF